MSLYDIKRWDVVMFENSITKNPMIYIKPDDSLLEFVKKNNNAVLITINDTESNYDGKQFVGVFDSSANVPNFRPNFFEKTGYYVVTFDGEWLGYPPKLGTVSFSGLFLTNEAMKQLNQNENDNIYRYLYIGLVILIFISTISILNIRLS